MKPTPAASRPRRPAPAAATSGAAQASPPTTPARRRSVSLAGLMLGLGAVMVASALAYGLSLGLGTGAVWAAPLAAAVGVALGGVPLALLSFKLGRESRPEGEAAGSAAAQGVARPLFMDLAQREWARARRYGSGAALLLVDIDRYARLCEARGPAAGHAVLAELLRQTAPTLRPADVLTRYSETQIAVLLAQADPTGALDVAERIRERAEHLELNWEGSSGPPQKLRVTVSAGVAHLRPAHLSLQALVDDAEDAVNAARQAGGNCVRAAPIESGRTRGAGSWRDERRAQPKQGGQA